MRCLAGLVLSIFTPTSVSKSDHEEEHTDFAAEWEESNAALEAAAEEAAEEAAVLQLQSLFRRFRSREDRSRRQASGVIQRFWRCVSARRTARSHIEQLKKIRWEQMVREAELEFDSL